MMAIADYYIHGERLESYHYIGMVSILACCVCISLSKSKTLAQQVKTES